MVIIGRLREGPGNRNVCNCEANALNGVTIAGLTIAQGMVGRIVVIAVADSVAQDIFHVGLTPAGADERVFVPNAVLDSIGPVVLPNGQRTAVIIVDGCVGDFCRMHGRDAGEQQGQSHAKGQNVLELFHIKGSFHY